MNHFFGTQYSEEDLRRQLAERRRQHGRVQSATVMVSPPGGQDDMDMSGMQSMVGGNMMGGNMMGGDSLDDIIMQNSKEMHRRQSMPSHYASEGEAQRGPAMMMDFGANNIAMNNYQYGMEGVVVPTQDDPRRQSMATLDMSPTYGDMSGNIGPASMGYPMPAANYMAPMSMQAPPLPIDTTGAFHNLGSDMMGDLSAYTSDNMNGLTNETPIYTANSYTNPYSAAAMGPMPMPNEYPMGMESMDTPSDPNSGTLTGSSGGTSSGSLVPPPLNNPEHQMMTAVPGLRISDDGPGMGSLDMKQGLDHYTPPSRPPMARERSSDESFISHNNMTDLSPAPAQPQPSPAPSKYNNIYSSSGFDMLRALMQVATRKNPEIDIGAVDMSCAFVVCDITQPDCPIIYVSDIFERLTGYSKFEVLGRNCRFLQDPEGKVVPGSKRMHVDNESVYYLKTQIREKREAQRSLINYRKGGQPFMNLLTMIPITWDTDEIKYFVGFQVDLVEQPSALSSKTVGGSYTVNYSQGALPQYVWTPPQAMHSQRDSAQTISADDVTALLISFKNNNQSESELSKRMWDKVLLENTDDVIHVLSLKGLFLYLSPSSQKVLEYDPSELVGTALSSVCHPSDIVPVTRELKDAAQGHPVDIVFRIRRKKSGYTWFESHGSLCVEQGKGRKCLILVGRERPVYALSRRDLERNSGIGDNEIWTKLSTSGMVLFISSNVRALLDRQPEELVGTSLQALMRPESKVEFGRSLEKARTGKQLTYKHEIMNKRGQQFQAQTTIYPGDASEGQKPTFLVGQTRLIRSTTRAVAPAGRGATGKGMSTMGQDDAMQATSPGSGSAGTPRSVTSTLNRGDVVTQAGGIGLAIGSQDQALASEDNIFDELKTTRCTSWQFELRQMEKNNRLLAEELAGLLNAKKKRKRRKGVGHLQQDCANCHAKTTPEWRRGPSGKRDLCNSCGLRWAKQVSSDAVDEFVVNSGANATPPESSSEDEDEDEEEAL